MIALIKKWFRKPMTGKASRRGGSFQPAPENLKQKTREGTDWAVKRYRRTFERLAEFDRT